MMNSDVSSMSICPSVKVDAYKATSLMNIDGNSMVNVSMPFIEDMTKIHTFTNFNNNLY